MHGLKVVVLVNMAQEEEHLPKTKASTKSSFAIVDLLQCTNTLKERKADDMFVCQ